MYVCPVIVGASEEAEVIRIERQNVGKCRETVPRLFDR